MAEFQQKVSLKEIGPFLWDFNHVDISKTLTNFIQYMTCCTRGDKTLDSLYANVKEA